MKKFLNCPPTVITSHELIQTHTTLIRQVIELQVMSRACEMVKVTLDCHT